MRTAWRLGGALLLAVLFAWGLRLVILEGFVYAWPRHFSGDFSVVILGVQWDGTGILYGPVVVFERWLRDAWPGVMTIEVFALANVVVAVAAFACGAVALRVPWPAVLISLVAWLCYSRLFYAFSVAANPEFLELAFLSGAWLAASRRHRAGEGVLVAAAALTKLIPWAFLAPVLVRRARRAAIVGVAATAAIVVTIVGIGQRMSPLETLRQTAIPVLIGEGDTAAQVEGVGWILQADSHQNLGVLQAVTRLFYGMDETRLTAGDIRTIKIAAGAVIAALLAAGLWAVWRLARAAPLPERLRLAMMYAVFFALLPVLSLATHPHTFVFLLPVWSVVGFLAFERSLPPGARIALVLWFGACYVTTGLPAGPAMVDRLLGTSLTDTWLVLEPMVGNVLAVAGLVTCAEYLARGPRVRTSASLTLETSP